MWRLIAVVGSFLPAMVPAVGSDTVMDRYGFPRPQRKIIVYSWGLNFRELADLRRMADVMQRQPFDGIMFSLFHNGKVRDEAFIHSTQLTDAEMAPAVTELSAINWMTFTDNFLMSKRVNASSIMDSRSAWTGLTMDSGVQSVTTFAC